MDAISGWGVIKGKFNHREYVQESTRKSRSVAIV